MLLLVAKVLSALPAVGLLGHAVYSAASLHDFSAAGKDVVEAVGLLGFSWSAHQAGSKAAATPANPAAPPK